MPFCAAIFRRMATLPAPDPARKNDARFVANMLHFARALRRAGLKAGPDRALAAVQALAEAGLPDRGDFRHALAAMFVSRPEERAVFREVFDLFWRDPRFDERMMAMMLPAMRGVNERQVAKPGARRAAEALMDDQIRLTEEFGEDEVLEIDASATASANERLRQLDFEQMSAEEMRASRRLLADLTLPLPKMPLRRPALSPIGPSINRRRTLARAFRTGGEVMQLIREKPGERFPNLVILCDISGSMSAYSRAVLHLAHGLANQRHPRLPLQVFTFGTRLTNITRHLQRRDVDDALARAGSDVTDWDGGTRIGDSLRAFNRDWARRVLGRGAVVLLLTDGLERGDPALLGHEMERLARLARSVIWVNPLLRFSGYAPLTEGAQAILPSVTDLRAGHNIAALEGLVKALSQPARPRVIA
jgi:uncharacterized protein